MSLAQALGAAVGKRLRLVIQGARAARDAYLAEQPPAGPRKTPAPPLDPRLAGYYANLELPPGSSLAAVTKAWKKLVREYHPDRHAGDPVRQAAATRLVQELNHAYRELAAYLEAQS